MKKYIYSAFLLALPLISLAQAPPCTGVICNPLGEGANIDVLIDRIINFLLYLASPLAVVMIVYAGFLFMTGGDKPEQVKKAKQTLLWTVVGVVILILAKSVTVFVKSFLE